MVVDTSFQSQPEDHMEDVVTLAVGEYAEDIHQYLREAEVSCYEKLLGTCGKLQYCKDSRLPLNYKEKVIVKVIS